MAPSVRRLKLLMTPLLANLGQESEPQVHILAKSHLFTSPSFTALLEQPAVLD